MGYLQEELVLDFKQEGFWTQAATMPLMQGFSCDDETGEVLCYNIDRETGEPAVENDLPFSGLRRNAKSAGTVKYMKFPKGFITKTKKFQTLKADIMTGSNKISYRLLLIPTSMIFPGLVCIILMLLEIFLHVRCHKNNKNLKDPTLYYRSPFHAVTSVFCGVCRECDSACKVGQLQDKRRFQYDYVRRIAI